MKATLRSEHLKRLQWLLLLLVLAAGTIVLFVAERATGSLQHVLREAGIVTVGTVMVSLVYEFVLRREHDEQVLAVVRDSLISNAGDYGLSGIERLNFAELFGRLESGDELWWLDTYCPDLDSPDVQDALTAAVLKGATVRMLVIHPEAATADARAQEIVAHGYQADEFQKDARHNLLIVEELRRNLDDAARARFEIRTYVGLPCAPMYLRVRDGRPLEGWTSYFLTLPTYQAAHLYWGRQEIASRGLCAGPGLGLQAFYTYCVNKWNAVPTNGIAGAGSDAARLLAEIRDTVERLRERRYAFVATLLERDIEDIVATSRKVLADGRLQRDQTAATCDLLLDLAQGEDILLVHSTSENAIFADVGFWRPFNDELARRVAAGRLASVHRLFILSDWIEAEEDSVLRRQIEFHNQTEKFRCRLLLDTRFKAIQDEVHVTSYPVHDFGIYGAAAYVWPRAGYGARDADARGYFQVDFPTVAAYRSLYQRCWEEGVEPRA